jgi:hypothetical protein
MLLGEKQLIVGRFLWRPPGRLPSVSIAVKAETSAAGTVRNRDFLVAEIKQIVTIVSRRSSTTTSRLLDHRSHAVGSSLCRTLNQFQRDRHNSPVLASRRPPTQKEELWPCLFPASTPA